MEATDKITAGTILVCIRTQATGCGIQYCKKGSIVKCALTPKSYHDSIPIFRNEKEEKVDKWLPVDRKKLRIASPEEVHMYYEGKYFLEEVEAAE